MKRPKGGAGVAALLEHAIQKIAFSDKTTETRRHQTLSPMKEGWHKAAKARQEVRETAAHSRLEAEERWTKRFHAWFKSRKEKRKIQQLITMEGTEMRTGAAMEIFTEEMTTQTDDYYECLMDAKRSRREARELLHKA